MFQLQKAKFSFQNLFCSSNNETRPQRLQKHINPTYNGTHTSLIKGHTVSYLISSSILSSYYYYQHPNLIFSINPYFIIPFLQLTPNEKLNLHFKLYVP